ncbi:hypothetical protein IMZ48_14780 [Candidatus Bathyarchaeota archaeon]|nr:hypothetical protein [Candidatus Bathyarchaeota archaeon]
MSTPVKDTTGRLAGPALGTMTIPEGSIFPSIPVGEEASTVTVEAGSEPTEVDVDDILEEPRHGGVGGDGAVRV